MKQLLTILLVSLGVAAQAQTKIKINDFVMRRGFVSDTATYCRIDCTALPIDLQTSQHRPTFVLTLHNALGQIMDSQVVTYGDMVNACVKNNIPENQHEAIITATYAAVFCGTKTQKLAAIRPLMAGYGITVKPDNEQ